MYIGGSRDVEKLAAGVGKVFAENQGDRRRKRSKTLCRHRFRPRPLLDPTKIDAILGVKGPAGRRRL